jgi:cytochrome b6-f complex iron-sulfur subunit
MDLKSRRKFLGICLGGVATATAASVLYTLYEYLAPRQAANTQGKVTIPEAEVPPDGAKFFDFRGASGVVVRKQNGELVALSAVCTHLGCIVQWEKDRQDFLCPCHAGRYTADGMVTAGPPPRPLARLPFTVAGGIITVG